MKKSIVFLFTLFGLFHAVAFGAKFTLESSAFQLNSLIPSQYTCNGKDSSPPLNWSNIPANTKSLALIVTDPDAPSGTWTHWVLFNIPPTLTTLDAGSPVPNGAATGLNSWGTQGYRGPCPTLGAHAYVFTLYALDTVLSLGDGTTNSIVSDAMTSHVLGSAELVGLYQKIPQVDAAP
jgi:Raf kinase inhibitor-like YbhB/YbcL family protein